MSAAPGARTFRVSAAIVAWVYAGYPLALVLAGRRGRPRARARIAPSVSVVIAVHDEAGAIAAKVANVRASDHPPEALEIVVASDGSTDGTPDVARAAGADVVLDLPRVGKIAALNEAVARSSGEILVFTDADSTFGAGTIAQLVSNFADPEVGGVAGSVRRAAAGGVGTGEGLYWRYEQWIKALEDRIGSAVSATGQLYAVRRSLFRPSAIRDGTDDFLISTQVVRAGSRLAFDPAAVVETEPPAGGRAELRRKVRVMNRGLRAAFSLGPLLLPWRGGLYGAQVVSHKILRRLVPFPLIAMLASSARMAAAGGRSWRAALAGQLGFYGLAAGGAVLEARGRRAPRAMAVPYYFTLANLAAGLAVVSLLRGRRYITWEPDRAPSRAASRPVRREDGGRQRTP